MNENIKEPIRRTRAYWYVDGLYELGNGVFFILLGIVLLIEASAPKDSSFANLMSLLRNLVLIGGTISVSLLVQAAKNRLTYPRTGYIIYPQAKGRKFGLYLGIGLAFSAVVSCGIVIGIMVIPALQTMIAYMPFWLMIGLGLFIGGLYLSWGSRTGLRRFYGLALLGTITGLTLALPARGLTIFKGSRYLLIGPGIFLIIMGIGLCISGATTLRSYLKHTQPLDRESSAEADYE